MDKVLCSVEKIRSGIAGVITLNCPNKLNAIDHSMLKKILKYLIAWKADDAIVCIILKGEGGRAFCAGGDIKLLYHNKQKGAELTSYFWDEYRLNHLIAHYIKPIISILDGITMGGGVGLGMHGQFKIATQNFKFAMPETIIGLFPDVGGKYLLARCPKPFGMYLALTGRSIDVDFALQWELVDYYVKQENINEFLNYIYELESMEQLSKACARFCENNTADKLEFDQNVMQHFNNLSIEDIIASLRKTNNEWCQKVYQELAYCAPLSLKVTFRAMQMAYVQTLEQCLYLDYRLVTRFLEKHDMFEGIRALLVDKDRKPCWEYKQLEQVSQQLIDEYFAPLEQELTWVM